MAGIEYSMIEIDRGVGHGALSDPACRGRRSYLIGSRDRHIVTGVRFSFPAANNRTRPSLCTSWQICGWSRLVADSCCCPPVLRLEREDGLERNHLGTRR